MSNYPDLWYNCEESGRRFIYNSTRVILIGGDWDVGLDDPLQGSEYACEGMVIGPSHEEEYPLDVVWDNEHSNQYRPDDLEIIDHLPIVRSMKEDNPNRAFRAHKKSSSNITNVDYTEEVKKVNEIRYALGLAIPEAHTLYTLHNGDVDAAITYYNLEHGSAAQSVDEDVEMSSEEFDIVQSTENMANQTATRGYIDAPPSYYDDEGVFSEEGTEQVIASKGGIVKDGIVLPPPGSSYSKEHMKYADAGCDPISSEEIARRAGVVINDEEIVRRAVTSHLNYTTARDSIKIVDEEKVKKGGFWERHKKIWRGQRTE
jgi:hypothetical protein